MNAGDERARLALHLHRASIQSDRERPVYGARVAVVSVLEAIVRHGAAGRYDFYYTPDPFGEPEPARDLLEQVVAQPSAGTFRVAPITAITQGADGPSCRAWHDADADLENASRLRAAYSRRLYPITAMTHVYSYQELLHDWILKLLLADIHPCDRLICPGRAARQALLNVFDEVAARAERQLGARLAFKGDVIHLPYGIDTDHFRPRDKVAVRRELGLPADALIVLWIGRISPVDKADLQPLLRVHHRLLASNPGSRLLLVIAGSGAQVHVDALRRQIGDLGIGHAVRTIDPMPPSQRHLVHAAADIFVSPADNVQEACGITPLEALACGVPQVVSDWDGYREMVDHGRTGFVVPSYWTRDDADVCAGSGIYDDYDRVDHYRMAQALAVDVDALEAACQTLIDRPDLRRQMGEASRRRAVDEFAAPRIVTAYEALWTELAHQASHLPFHPGAHDRYDTPAFVAMFAHYGTRVLDDAALVVIAAEGRRVVSGEVPWPSPGAAVALSMPLLTEALHVLASAPGPMTIGQLVERVATPGRPRPAGERRHVMWLLKYGLIGVLSNLR